MRMQNHERNTHLEEGDCVGLFWPYLNEVTDGLSKTAVGPALFLCTSLTGSYFVSIVTSAWKKDDSSVKPQSRPDTWH